MKVMLLTDLPVPQEYGLTEGRIIDAKFDPGDGLRGVLVTGDNGKRARVLPREYEVVRERNLTIEEILKACNAATDGPWKIEKCDCDGNDCWIVEPPTSEKWFDVACTKGNAEFIAMARTALPEICGEVKRLELELKYVLAAIAHEGVEATSRITKKAIELSDAAIDKDGGKR